MHHLKLQRTVLAIVPDKPKMCLQENIVKVCELEWVEGNWSELGWLQLFISPGLVLSPGYLRVAFYMEAEGHSILSFLVKQFLINLLTN